MKRPLAAITAIIATTVLVGACGMQGGSAATSTAGDISESALTSQVQEILVAQGLPPTAPDAALTSKTLTRMIDLLLVDTMATKAGVTITQGQIDSAIAQYVTQAGSQQAVDQSLATNGLAPSQLPSIVRINLQAQAIAKKLAPQGTAQEQSDAFSKALVTTSLQLNVTVNPRFGAWDPAQAVIVPAPNDLSAPPAGA